MSKREPRVTARVKKQENRAAYRERDTIVIDDVDHDSTDTLEVTPIETGVLVEAHFNFELQPGLVYRICAPITISGENARRLGEFLVSTSRDADVA